MQKKKGCQGLNIPDALTCAAICIFYTLSVSLQSKEVSIYNMIFGLTWYCLYKLKGKLINFLQFFFLLQLWWGVFGLLWCTLTLHLITVSLFTLSCSFILAIFKSLIMFSSFKDLVENTENNSSWKQFCHHVIDFVFIKIMIFFISYVTESPCPSLLQMCTVVSICPLSFCLPDWCSSY